MPQGRRKTPFSGKAKKEQLRAKKQGKNVPEHLNKGKRGGNFVVREEDSDDDTENAVQRINAQPRTKGKATNSTRYALQFFQETKEEMQAKKDMAQKELQPKQEEELEICIEDYFPPELDFPKRPPWDFTMSRDHLDAKEQKYFREYVSALESKFDRKDLSLFELNLETWRQLWRVLEMSDLILIIVDIRFPVLMFPPSLYKYVVSDMKKEMILVLNKVDLAPAPLVVAWTDYFKKHFPSLQIVMFTSFPGYNILGNTQDKAGLQQRRRKGRLRMAAEGSQKLLEACKEIVKDEVDLSSWQTKIKEEMEIEIEEDDDDELIVGETIQTKKVDTSFEVHERFKGGVLTIGCVGQPNVGKSSLMNAVMGKKVVSVSRTPGHTKHFQTIFLTNNVRLCDCPGLVFPSKVPKALQVIMGSYPIAQLREPFSVVMFVAERLDLIKLLRIQHPENDTYWSAMDICDGWALKRGFKTARTGRLDSYRAANSLLRMTLDGKITLCLRPPGYLKHKRLWEEHSDVPMVKWIQARLQDFELGNYKVEDKIDYSSEDDEKVSAMGKSSDRGSNIDISDENHGESSGDSADDEEEDNTEATSSKGNRFSALVD